MEKKNNKEYWLDRVEYHDTTYMRKAEKVIVELKRSYKEAYKDILNQLAYIYATTDNIDLASFNEKRRLDKLLKDIKVILEGVGSEVDKKTTEHLADTYLNNYLDMNTALEDLGINTSFDTIPRKQVLEAIKTNWSGKMFSDSVWWNTQVLAERTKDTIIRGIIQGKSIHDMARELDDLSKVGAFASDRLIRTETNFTVNNSHTKNYEDNGITKYEFIAYLDNKTSKICRRLNGQVFNVKDAVSGVNRPPMHPNCRSQIIPLVDDILKTVD